MLDVPALDAVVKRILQARVYDVAIESPLDEARLLSRRLKNKILIKREDLQPVFSFKLRGAFNKIVKLSDGERANGVICASAGNHAQGVALSARKLGCRAVIVMPVTTPKLKVDAVAALGGYEAADRVRPERERTYDRVARLLGRDPWHHHGRRSDVRVQLGLGGIATRPDESGPPLPSPIPLGRTVRVLDGSSVGRAAAA